MKNIKHLENALNPTREKAACTKIRLLYCVAGFTTLFGGIAVYTFFRNLDMVLFRFIPRPVFLNTLFIPVTNDSTKTSLFLFNLPDGLWVLSGLLFLRALWHKQPKIFFVYRLCFLLTAFLLEISQVFDGIAGTFDIFDVLTTGSFALLESVFHKIRLMRSEK